MVNDTIMLRSPLSVRVIKWSLSMATNYFGNMGNVCRGSLMWKNTTW